MPRSGSKAYAAAESEIRFLSQILKVVVCIGETGQLMDYHFDKAVVLLPQLWDMEALFPEEYLLRIADGATFSSLVSY